MRLRAIINAGILMKLKFCKQGLGLYMSLSRLLKTSRGSAINALSYD